MLGSILFLVLLGTVPYLNARTVDWRQLASERAPKAWASYRMRAEHLQGAWATLFRSPTTKEIVAESRGELRQREHRALFVEQQRVDSQWGQVSATNSRYAFVLSRSLADKPWAVQEIGNHLWEPLAKNDPAFWVRRIVAMPCTLGCLHSAYSVLNVFDPGFMLKDVTSIENDGNKMIKIDFDYAPEVEPRGPRLANGWILLDPEHSWILRKCSAEMIWGNGNKGTDTVELEYDTSDDGFPILTRYVNRRVISAQNYDLEIVGEYDLHERDLPEADFTLSAFGFPEPAGIAADPPPKPTRWYLWIALAGGISLLVAVFFSWQIKKARAAAASAAKP